MHDVGLIVGNTSGVCQTYVGATLRRLDYQNYVSSSGAYLGFEHAGLLHDLQSILFLVLVWTRVRRRSDVNPT